jgi:membrane fusion protein (multidrug efflux system)
MRELAEFEIQAPGDGYLAGMNVHPNEIVTAGAKVGDLLQLDQVYVETFVPLAAANRLKPGVRANVQADGQAATAGRIKLVGQKVDPVSGSVRVKLLVPNAAHRLKPGMIVRVRF